MIRVRTSEGMELEVEREILEQSQLIKGLLEDVGHSNAVLPLPNVSGPILAKVVEYCRHHQLHGPSRGPDAEDDPTDAASALTNDGSNHSSPVLSGGHGAPPLTIRSVPPSTTRALTTGATTTALSTAQPAPADVYPVPQNPANLSAQALSNGDTTTAGKKADTIALDEWDREFCKVDQGTLYELILAANYLDIKPLLDLTCLTVANMIRGKRPEEIRKTFNIKNDFTPEEEEIVKKENEWCEDR
ncbi:hypothetical protein IWQ60_003678 [Tieghemiomyces parasiticus]|uniref:E3 ubiquitin ligase complex SCF subunit n=1 Tax=Tieghemiomyces parasiticus TaxID=78921 RepID=A0A9W8DUK4_9FUNG|nr:hypothetical protein IWQ60_003678 [Tieghemiomyces parasiticus]